MPVAMRGRGKNKPHSSSSSTITQSSPASAATATRPSSELLIKNIDHLPDSLLVEILCRLPCFKSVFQCKLVSKRWCTLMSDPHFIRRFLYLQRNHKQKPIGTAISMTGEELLDRISPSSRPLAQLFKRLVSIHGLKQEPVVVGTYNDLVLCCASEYSQRDYYICNPHTIQWVPLPPPPQVYKYVAVGFTCDLPYYNYRENDQQGDIIHLNAEYKYRVVRLIDHSGDRDDDKLYRTVSCKFKVQIFFSETGEWREFILSTPSPIDVGYLSESIVVASNRMLYWLRVAGEVLVGLDPFAFDTTTGNLFAKPCKSVYLVDEEMVVSSPATGIACAVVFDPNNEDILYMSINNTGDRFKKDVIRCNISTGEVSKVATKQTINTLFLFPLMLPWWPTPVPRLPQRGQPSPNLIII